MAMHVEGAPEDLPLRGIRVLDLTDRLGVAGPRLLAALGAEVLRVEQPSDDAVRTQGGCPTWRGTWVTAPGG